MTHIPEPSWDPAYIEAIRTQTRRSAVINVPRADSKGVTLTPEFLEDCFRRCLEKMGEPYCDACENLRMERVLGRDNDEIVIPCSVCCPETPAKWSHPSNVNRYDLRNTQENE